MGNTASAASRDSGPMGDRGKVQTRKGRQEAVKTTTMTDVSERSYEYMQVGDLRRLAVIALKNLDRLVKGDRTKYGWCENHLLRLCLCQGAAEHYVLGEHGIKDFDVWAFYEEQRGEKSFPWRRRSAEDYGPSRFGRHPDEKRYTCRRIDIFGRSIARDVEQSPEDAVRTWLRSKGESAKQIARKPVVVLYPKRDCGRVIWDPRGGTQEQHEDAPRTSRSTTEPVTTVPL